MNKAVDFYFSSEKGKRENNEDFYGNFKDKLFVVADGLGGHAAGEVASEISVQIAIEEIKDTKDIEKVIKEANRKILSESERNDKYAGMATTFVCALVYPDEVVFGSVGDSRGYLFTQGNLKRITKDDRNSLGVLTEALGIDEVVAPHIYKEEIKKGDTVLLCTDGLTDFVKEEVIEKILKSGKELGKIAKGLIEVSLQFGSTDNITVGLIRL